MGLFRREDHPALVALKAECKRALQAGEISRKQATLLRLQMRFNPDRVVDGLEEAAEVEMEAANPPLSTGPRDWTPEQWAELVKSIFATLVESLPTLMGICAA